MSVFFKFPKGQIKRNLNFYGSVVLAITYLLLGVLILDTGEFYNSGYKVAVHENDALLLGWTLISFSLCLLYYLFFMAARYEENRPGFHTLEDFTEIIEGYNTNFVIEPNILPSANNSGIRVFSYKLEIYFKKKLEIQIEIRRRDKFELLLWKIGLTRIFDVLTDNEYFDSRYRVKTKNRLLLRKFLNPKSIKLLEIFDKDYPPIRSKNGILILTKESLKYIEGPYREEQKLFDPHRGVIEDLFNELLEIVKAIEGEEAHVSLETDNLGADIIVK